MILLVLVFASNFVFTWIIRTACVCACVAGENQASGVRVLHFSRFLRSQFFSLFTLWRNKIELIFLYSRIRANERICH